MDPIYNFLNKIAYKFDKGYPELTNPKDRLIIESMLSELGISIDLLETTTSATEDLHEIFTAMFVAGHQPVEDFANADWEKEVNNTPRLKNKQQHIDIISKYIGPNLPLKDKYSKLYDDAKKIADQLEINLDFSDAGAERVFATGPKEKADIIIYQPGRRESGLGVSLKYGEGQFNSLSPNTVLKNLFDLKDLQAPTISPETGKLSKVPGILTQVTKDDDVRLDGQKIIDNQTFRTILINKPEGYITTMHDPLKRKTVMELIDFKERLFPIGRLDKDTSGLLLLTNNGHLANKLTHPKNKIPRIYELEIDKPFENWEKRKIAKNIYIGQKEWGRGEIIEQKKNKGRTIVLMRLHQGKKREIRRIVYRMKRTLFSLKRIQFGPIRLDGTPIGSYRELHESEIKEISRL